MTSVGLANTYSDIEEFHLEVAAAQVLIASNSKTQVQRS